MTGYPSSAAGGHGGPPAGTENTDSYFTQSFDPVRRRLHLRYHGFWTENVARQVLQAFRAALESASPLGQPFTLLDDCRDWGAQSKEVMEIDYGFVPICREFPITRNAMIIPSALVRQQVRRTLTDFEICEVFATFEEADTWLAEVEPRPASVTVMPAGAAQDMQLP